MLIDPCETEAELDGGNRRSDGPVYPAGCACVDGCRGDLGGVGVRINGTNSGIVHLDLYGAVGSAKAARCGTVRYDVPEL